MSASWWSLTFFVILTVTSLAYIVKGITIVSKEDYYILYEEDEFPDGFYIPCDCVIERKENPKNIEVEWSKDGEIVFSRKRMNGEWSIYYRGGYTRMEIRGPPHPVKSPTDMGLIIKDPARVDKGVWSCNVSLLANRERSTDQYQTEILVYYGPNFLFDERDSPTSPDIIQIEQTYCENLTLTCHAEAFPPVQLTLLREDKNSVLPNGKSYYIGEGLYGLPDEEKILVADFGNTSNLYRGGYICLAVALSQDYPKYPDGKKEERHVIDIDMYHVTVARTSDNGIVQAPVGYKEISLKCSVIEESLSSSAKWLFSGNYISDDPTKYAVKHNEREKEYELVIFNIGSLDYGTYTCEFENSIGIGSATIELREGNAPITAAAYAASRGFRDSPTLVVPLLFLATSYYLITP